MDEDGTNITPASNTITSFGGTFETILTADQAAGYSYDKMFTDWDPAALAKQVVAPSFVKLDGTTLTWEDNKSATAWAVLKDGKVIDFVTTASYTIDDASAVYAVRAANGMGGLSAAVVANNYITITLPNVGYGTIYDSENTFVLPADLKAYVVSSANMSELTYTEVADYIPAGTAVMLEDVNKKGGEFNLYPASAKVTYKGANLLKGSDVATTTTAEENSLFYKLSFGKSNTPQAGTFGWFWGAANGGAFEIEAHRAWLAIPVLQQNTPVIGYIVGTYGDGTTAIRNIENKQDATGEYYNLQGQRVNAPAKGLYIHNGKKVVIK